MSRRSEGECRRNTVDIFSLSFLDVIACGVGVVLFISLLVMVQAVKGVDQKAVSEIERLESDLRGYSRLEAESAEAPTSAALYRKLRNELTSTSAEVAAIEGQLSELSELAASVTVFKQLEQTQEKTQQMEEIKNLLYKRRPITREASKLNLCWFVFSGGGRVRLIERQPEKEYTLASDDYDITRDSDGDNVLTEKGEGRTVDEALSRGILSDQFLRNFRRAEHDVECIVSPEGFEDFVRVREALYVSGVEVSVIYAPASKVQVIGRGGRRGRSQ